MGLETATYPTELVLTNPVGGTDTKAQGDDHIRLLKTVIQSTFPGFAGRIFRVLAQGSVYTAVLNDNARLFYISGTTWTLGLTAAATLGNGWMIHFINHATGDITIDPDGAELINGVSTVIVPPGSSGALFCDGTGFKVIIVPGRIASAYSVGGTVDAITAVCHPPIRALTDKTRILVRAAGANTIVNPTFAPDGLTAKVVVKRNGVALSPGDIVGSNFEMDLIYNLSLDQWVMLNANNGFAKPTEKDHGTQAGNYTLYLDEAETHLVAFSALATLTISSRNTNDRAIVIVKNGGFAITLAGIDTDAPTLTNGATVQDFLGLVKSFGKMTCISYVLNKVTA